MKKIRTGIIRGDLHATYYVPLMQEHDPIVLREPEIGLGGYFYHYLMFNDPGKLTSPKVWEFDIVKVWDYDRAKAENLSKILFGKPKVCDTFEEVSDDVDLIFIPDCSDEGKDHLELATPGIKKGVPTFVDKPFTYDVVDAKKMYDLANKYNVPVFSRSMLPETRAANHFKNRFDELDSPKFGLVKGGSTGMNSMIHSVSLALKLFGFGVEWVEAMGESPQVIAQIGYGDRTDRPVQEVVLNCVPQMTYHCSYYASAYSEWGAIHSTNMGDFEFPYGAAKVLEMIKDMVQTRNAPISAEEVIEPVAVCNAIRIAQQERRRVFINELMK